MYTKQKHITVLLALLFVFAACLPLVSSRRENASAQEELPDVYFITTCPERGFRYADLFLGFECNLATLDWSDRSPKDLLDDLLDFVLENEVKYLVLNLWSIDDEWLVGSPDAKADEIFRQIHEAECKIMLILETDEGASVDPMTQYDPMTFLQYVDVHVNTDMFLIYFDSAMQKIERWLFENFPNATTNSVNYNLLVGPIARDPERDPFSKYWGMYEKYNTYKAPIDFLSHYHVNIIRWEVDQFSNIPELDPLTTFSMATTWNPPEYYMWESTIDTLRARLDDFPVFICNDQAEAGVTLFGENVYTINDIRPILEENLPLIFKAWLAGEDLSVFDNWSGWCDVTYKPIIQGDGWLRAPRYPELPA